jgi:hypothetical protein
MLSYTFTYAGTGGPEVVNETGGSDSFTIATDGNGLLEWSADNGSTFSTQWGGVPADTLSASAATSVTINLGADHSAIIDGTTTTASSSASDVLAALTVNAFPGNIDDSLTINDSSSSLGAGTYTYDGLNRTITGPASAISVQEGPDAFGGGVTIQGSNAGNVLNLLSTWSSAGIGEPVTLLGGSGGDTANIDSTTAGAPATVSFTAGTNVVNVGGNGSTAAITAPVVVTGPATLNADDSADNAANSLITLDDLSGNSIANYEVVGLAGAPIEYGPGVTALDLQGGVSGISGVTFAVDNTQTGTTTTITGGANQNFLDLGDPSEAGGLDNLAGPVVFHGGLSHTDGITLDDSGSSFAGDYAVGPTTVSRSGFGGLTYDGNIASLTLNAENNLGIDTIDINSTADDVTTNINGQDSRDTINVNGTGISGSLDITTCSSGSTANVVADSEPVNLTLGHDVVNIGSTGGAGTMAGILGAIGITDPASDYSLTFHDENDATGNTWTLNNDDSSVLNGSASVGLGGAIATTTYSPVNLSAPLTIDGGSGGNTFDVNDTTASQPTDLNTGLGNDTVDVFATGNNTLNVDGQGGQDAVTLGASALDGMQGLNGTISVGNDAGTSALTLDDSQDANGPTASMTNNGTTGTVTGLSPATVSYTDAAIGALNVLGGAGHNTFTINGTAPGIVTTLNEGPSASNTVNILTTDTGSTLNLTGTGSYDQVTIGQSGSVTGILGTVSVNNAAASTDLEVDLSGDALPHALDLSSNGTTSTLHDNLDDLAVNITYTTASLAELGISTDGDASQSLNVDFGAGGNPIPISAAGSPGLDFNAGVPVPSMQDTLTTSGLPITTSESTDLYDPGVSSQAADFGSIAFSDSTTSPATTTTIWYSGLTNVPVVANHGYTAQINTALTVDAGSGVLANDTDGSGGTLTAVVVSSPANGSLTLNPDGSFTYTPTSDYTGPDSFSYEVTDGAAVSAPQTVSLLVDAPPQITSADSAAFQVGASGIFLITTTGYTTPALSEAGALPQGVTFVDNGDGTATLQGTPAFGSAGAYDLSIDATNGSAPDASQNFVFTVNQAPTITSASSTQFPEGQPASFMVTTAGYPVAALTEAGALPAGVTFVDNGDGTATLAGTPTEPGTYPLTLDAGNGVGTDATQSFNIVVGAPKSISSADADSFMFGQAGSFTVTTTGAPNPTLTESGNLPAGLSFVDNGDGTATLSGTPGSGSVGTYDLTIGASYAGGTDLTQPFTLAVNPAPVTINLTTPPLTYSGLPQIADASTTPSAVAVAFTYNGLPAAPTNPGTYAIVASSADPDYVGTAQGSMTIAPAHSSIALVAPASAVYTGTAQGVKATVIGVNAGANPGTATLTYFAGNTTGGAPLSSAPVDPGTYTVLATYAGSPDYTSASGTTTYSIVPAMPVVTIAAPDVPYTGAPQPVAATVTGAANGAAPGSATLTYYSGSSASGAPLPGAPTNAGTYTVVATYQGDLDYAPATASAVYTISGTPVVTPVTGTGLPGSDVYLAPLSGVASVAGDTFTASLLTQPGYGTASVVSVDGVQEFLYHPGPGAFTTDTFTYQITDRFGNSATATATVNYSGAGLVSSYLNRGKTDLVIVEPSGDHTVTIANAGAGSKVKVTVDGVTQGVYTVTGRVFGFAPTGNDTFNGSATSASLWFYGGTGNNSFIGGSGGDIFVGGSGNDYLNGHTGRNLIIGGGGTNTLVGVRGQDVLVAGGTIYDAPTPDNQTALLQILATWQATNRLPKILGGVGAAHGGTDAPVLDDATITSSDTGDVILGTRKSWYIGDFTFDGGTDIFNDGRHVKADQFLTPLKDELVTQI